MAPFKPSTAQSSSLHSSRYQKIRKDVVLRDFIDDLNFFVEQNDLQMDTPEGREAYPKSKPSKEWVPLTLSELHDQRNFGKTFEWNAPAIKFGESQREDWTLSMTEVQANLTINHFLVGTREYLANPIDYPMLMITVRGKKWGKAKLRVCFFPENYEKDGKTYIGHSASFQLFRFYSQVEKVVSTVKAKGIEKLLPEGKTMENSRVWDLLPFWLAKANKEVKRQEMLRETARERARENTSKAAVAARKGGYLVVDATVGGEDPKTDGGPDLPQPDEIFDINEEG